MRNEGLGGIGSLAGRSMDGSDLEKQENVGGNSAASAEDNGGTNSDRDSLDKGSVAVISVVVSRGDAHDQVSVSQVGSDLNRNVLRVAEGHEKEKLDSANLMKISLSRSGSYQEKCRVCHQQSEEALMNLGCQCRGELAKAHLSCIEIWFHTKGSNKCEICQQVAENVPFPEVHPSANYWIWRVDPAVGRSNFVQVERERGCFSPLWVAFSILIGGLLLDVLISISLGVSALPVNIIIGVLVVLGLGTALRLTLECCQEWSSRRASRVETTLNPDHNTTV